MEHIKVAVISFTPNMLDLLLAKERGFYSAQGLEVQWVPLAGEKGIRGLLEGEVDFSVQIAAALRLVMTENAGLKIVLIIHRDPPHGACRVCTVMLPVDTRRRNSPVSAS